MHLRLTGSQFASDRHYRLPILTSSSKHDSKNLRVCKVDTKLSSENDPWVYSGYGSQIQNSNITNFLYAMVSRRSPDPMSP